METSPDALIDGLANESTLIRAVKDIAYGSAAGMVSKVFEHPFDLTKVRLQSQVLDSTARFSGPIDCLTQTWKKEGVRGLYRGLPAPVVGAMAENASLFVAYGEFQNVIRRVTNRTSDEKLPLYHLALAAAGAGAVTSFILTPIELVKCKMQVQMLVPATASPATPRSLPGPFSILFSVIRTTGLRGLWLGQTGTLIRETGGTAAWFGTKEYIAGVLLARRRRLEESSGASGQTSMTLRPWESALSGACAGAAFNFALFPADTVKSAMQTAEELRPAGASAPKPTFGGTFMAMYRAQGIKGLYAGCGITVARSIPSSAIIFLIYDGLRKHFG
ncbi:Amino-acid transporter arg-13 [Psilocybe cubensis]|uniref:Amino-acid transporter arg-13 n=2 Tax=Psilocybe cubensis TaxID=181762 RepID=A0ACB8GPE0_PSICU|nr:Amino-acid transporter arg-13 [Psilocybe cubensis]KAH9477418.1 Amino-acid transporter arg-13 [Psilocybe cubensis]